MCQGRNPHDSSVNKRWNAALSHLWPVGETQGKQRQFQADSALLPGVVVGWLERVHLIGPAGGQVQASRRWVSRCAGLSRYKSSILIEETGGVLSPYQTSFTCLGRDILFVCRLPVACGLIFPSIRHRQEYPNAISFCLLVISHLNS